MRCWVYVYIIPADRPVHARMQRYVVGRLRSRRLQLTVAVASAVAAPALQLGQAAPEAGHRAAREARQTGHVWAGPWSVHI